MLYLVTSSLDSLPVLFRVSCILVKPRLLLCLSAFKLRGNVKDQQTTQYHADATCLHTMQPDNRSASFEYCITSIFNTLDGQDYIDNKHKACKHYHLSQTGFVLLGPLGYPGLIINYVEFID